ncbi:MAG: hypothetical protein PHO07_00510 [Pirellulales bacterium]|nr:hypothetical protein [Thermoguttaceae bacterium]MDD4785627.1 hypothetical protein [Pirellulales bacterium]
MDHRDAARAEQILLEGLASPDVDDREFLLDRLLLLYEETGKDEEAGRVREQLEQIQKPKTTTAVRFGSDSIQVRQKHDSGRPDSRWRTCRISPRLCRLATARTAILRREHTKWDGTILVRAVAARNTRDVVLRRVGNGYPQGKDPRKNLDRRIGIAEQKGQ